MTGDLLHICRVASVSISILKSLDQAWGDQHREVEAKLLRISATMHSATTRATC